MQRHGAFITSRVQPAQYIGQFSLLHVILPQPVSSPRGGLPIMIMGLHSSCFSRTCTPPERSEGGGTGGPHQQPSRSSEADHHDQAWRKRAVRQSQQGGRWTLQGLLPAAAWPYAQLMRLDKPIGTWLLAWPGFWWAQARRLTEFC